MRQPELLSMPLAIDDRGSLMAVEFSSVPFTVRRAFSVTGPTGGAVRGEHVVPCAQLLVLTAGAATVRVGRDATTLGDGVDLTTPGDAVLLEKGEFIWYRLADEHSTALVLAELPYEGSPT